MLCIVLLFVYSYLQHKRSFFDKEYLTNILWILLEDDITSIEYHLIEVNS